MDRELQTPEGGVTPNTELSAVIREKRLATPGQVRGRRLLREMWECRAFYLLMLPGLVCIILFSYVPMPGIVIAFKEYSFRKGILGSPWVGFQHFRDLFTGTQFTRVLRNSLSISLINLIFGFPAPIILALLLNELYSELFKRSMQTVYYLPHFFSWPILASLTFFMLSERVGVVNNLITELGREPVAFLTTPKLFYP